MKKTLSGYYQPTEEEFSRLWANCKFIVDSNVLLNMHRYSQKARDDLLSILRAVSDRVWIPHQVAIEYQENRLYVIAEQAKRFRDVKEELKSIQNRLQSVLEGKQLTKDYSSIKVDGFTGEVNRVFDEFSEELDKTARNQPDVIDNDKIRDEIDSLFESRVGVPPISQAALDDIYKEGQLRYQRKQPPGYMDLKKADNKEENTYSYGGLVFKREYGDIVIWNQIIDKAKDNKEFENIIFITDDNKEDWWWQVDSMGRKTIGPRPELVAEIKSKAGVLLFYMYNLEHFMQRAEQHLGIEVEKESIEQVRDQSQLLYRLQLAARKIRQGRRTELEFANIQAAVHAMMVDNGLSSLPVPVLIGTNDMQAFPEVTATLITKGAPDAAFVTAAEAALGVTLLTGYPLYGNTIINDVGTVGTYEAGEVLVVNYVATQYTSYLYTVDAFGVVTQGAVAP